MANAPEKLKLDELTAAFSSLDVQSRDSVTHMFKQVNPRSTASITIGIENFEIMISFLQDTLDPTWLSLYPGDSVADVRACRRCLIALNEMKENLTANQKKYDDVLAAMSKARLG